MAGQAGDRRDVSSATSEFGPTLATADRDNIILPAGIRTEVDDINRRKSPV